MGKLDLGQLEPANHMTQNNNMNDANRKVLAQFDLEPAKNNNRKKHTKLKRTLLVIGLVIVTIFTLYY